MHLYLQSGAHFARFNLRPNQNCSGNYLLWSSQSDESVLKPWCLRGGQSFRLTTFRHIFWFIALPAGRPTIALLKDYYYYWPPDCRFVRGLLLLADYYSWLPSYQFVRKLLLLDPKLPVCEEITITGWLLLLAPKLPVCEQITTTGWLLPLAPKLPVCK